MWFVTIPRSNDEDAFCSELPYYTYSRMNTIQRVYLQEIAVKSDHYNTQSQSWQKLHRWWYTENEAREIQSILLSSILNTRKEPLLRCIITTFRTLELDLDRRWSHEVLFLDGQGSMSRHTSQIAGSLLMSSPRVQ